MSMDPVSQGATQPRAQKRKLKESKPKTPFELKREEDLELSDFSMYDDISRPYVYACRRFVYMNKAMIQQQKAIAEYKEQSRKLNLSPYDATGPPPNLGLCGGVSPITITDELRPRLIELCTLALVKYNAENENQGSNFVFHDLIKSTSALVSGRIYYITFQAKDATHPLNSATPTTFQAKVYDKIHARDVEPVVKSCSMKPT